MWLPAAFIGVFFVGPIIAVAVRSFFDPAPGFGNYAEVLFSGIYLQVIWNTLGTALIVTFLCLLIAYPLAYVMAKAKGSMLAVMTSIVVVSLWTSVVIRSYAWMVIFQRRGVLNNLLTSTGLTDGAINFLPGAIAVNVGMVHIMLPFMVLPILSNMRSIDTSLLTAASVMGANPWLSFYKVFLPLSFPGISAGSALVTQPPHGRGPHRAAGQSNAQLGDGVGARNCFTADHCSALSALSARCPIRWRGGAIWTLTLPLGYLSVIGSQTSC